MSFEYRLPAWQLRHGKLVLIASLLVGLLIALPAEGALIRMKHGAVVATPIITLGDVAEILHNDPEMVARLSAVTLVPAPPPGRQIQIDFATIRDRLEAKGFNLAELEFAGHSEITVSNKRRTDIQQTGADRMPPPGARYSDTQQRLVEAKIAAAVAKAIHTRYSEAGRVTVDPETRPTQMEQLLSVDLDGYESDGGHPPFTGAQLFEIRFKDRRGMNQTMQIKCSVSSVPRVLTVGASVPRGHVIQAEDLAWRQVDPASFNPSIANETILDRPDLVIGKEATRNLRPDDPISSEAIRDVPLVRAGEIVTLYARRRGITVRMETKARTSGALGEVVSLTSLDGKDKFQARVIRFHEAEVIQTQIPGAAPPANPTIKFLPMKPLKETREEQPEDEP